jgi:hypothetical protein
MATKTPGHILSGAQLDLDATSLDKYPATSVRAGVPAQTSVGLPGFQTRTTASTEQYEDGYRRAEEPAGGEIRSKHRRNS